MTRASDRILATLPRLRAEAEALMTATATIYRKTGQTRDGVRLVAVWTVVYTGRCKVQTYEGYEQTPGSSSGATVTVQRSQIHVPVGAYSPEPGDVARLDTSRDPHMIVRLWRVTTRWPVKEHATAYRASAEELIGDDLTTFESGEVIP